MPRDCFFTLTISPDIVPSAVAQKLPAELAEGILQLTSLHLFTVHILVDIIKCSLTSPA